MPSGRLKRAVSPWPSSLPSDWVEFPAREVNELARLPVGNWKDWLVNDFEKPVFEQFPVIGEIKTSMYELGALYAAMSGSGSAVYGIFDVLPADYGVFRGCFVWVSPVQ